MFDLTELDRAEAALRRLAARDLPPVVREPAPAEMRKGDLARCPFHNGARARPEMAAA